MFQNWGWKNQETKNGEPPNSSKDARSDAFTADKKVTIPEVNNKYFSFKKLWAFSGPGLLMSIAYLDPGNIESDLRCGSIAGCSLLWVLLLSSIIALFIQTLSARLGVVTGSHLAEMCYQQYRKIPRIALWIMVEIAIVASDAQEVIGTAIAIYLLSNETVPLWAGAIITLLDTLTFSCLGNYGLRKLEMVFLFLVSVMGISFGYQYIVSKPDQLSVIKGIFVPGCDHCTYDVVMQGVAIVGATIMPHNVYLHSALVKSRDVNRENYFKIKEANMYFLVEAGLAVFFTFLINVFVVGVFARGFYRITNRELIEGCRKRLGNITIVPDDDELLVGSLHTGGIYLRCKYGLASKYIWGIGILASGQSATMTGTFAGQFTMEGFLNLQWPRWVTLSLRRSAAITPTFLLAYFTRVEELTIMNDIMNIVNCVQIPFAAIPIIAFTSDKRIMGEAFVNNWPNRAIAICLSTIVIGINSYFAIMTLVELKPHGAVLGLVLIFGVLYLLFCIYLTIHMFVLISEKDLSTYNFVKKYVLNPTEGYTSVFQVCNEKSRIEKRYLLILQKPKEHREVVYTTTYLRILNQFYFSFVEYLVKYIYHETIFVVLIEF